MSDPLQPSSMTTDVPAVTTPTPPAFTQPIVATTDRKFFIKRLIIALAVIGGGLYFLYDGYVGYPNHNKRIEEITAQVQQAQAARDQDRQATLEAERKGMSNGGQRRSDRDILIQRIIGYVMVPIGLFLLTKFVRESKGELRLEHDTLHAPGHPPIPINALTGLNNVKWEKKGIALFDYKLPDGTAGTVRIDDFLFTRPPTDAIHDELVAKMPKGA